MRDNDDCQPYVEHLRREHEHLHEALHTLQTRLRELCACEQKRQSHVQAIVANLCELREELRRHFLEEEEGGCLEEAQSRSPSIADDVKRVRAEHSILQRGIDRLVQAAQALMDNPSGLVRIEQDFAQFAAAVRQHEEAESRIILYGFGADAMDEITEEPTPHG